jgi:hypothetical protein
MIPQEAALLMFAGENADKDEKKKTATEKSSAGTTTSIQKRVQETFYLLNLIARRKLNSLMNITVFLGLLSALHDPQYLYLALKLLHGERCANAPGAAATLEVRL